MVLTHDAPHIVLRCNPAFTSLTGLQLNDIIGMPLRDTFLFGDLTETGECEEFLSALRLGRSGPSHTVLTLYQSMVLAGTLKCQTPNLYSLHAFPVFKRAAASGSLPVPIPDGSAPEEANGLYVEEEETGAAEASLRSTSVSLPNLSTVRTLK